MSVRAVLWDADGVLQEVPGSWLILLAELIGEDRAQALLVDAWPLAQDAMRGRAELHLELERVLAEHGLTGQGDQIREVWGTFHRFEDSRALVAELRESGVSCHLATNQDQLRASYMRERLGYDDLFDSCFYSCDLGEAKPDPAYFERVLDALGLQADEVAFIDDTSENTDAAATLGIRAICWHHRDGVDTLRSRLTEHGVVVLRSA